MSLLGNFKDANIYYFMFKRKLRQINIRNDKNKPLYVEIYRT